VGQDSEPRYDWANAQNDAIGYSLQLIGEAHKQGVIHANRELIDVVISYLETIRYWEDSDSGHWEEIKKVNASSIGTVIAGLRAVREVASDSIKVTALIEKGSQALDALLPFESKSSSLVRQYDAALIFLIEPQHVVDDGMAVKILSDVEKHLMGGHGFRRYVGDSYWAPDYREHFQLGDRTADFSKPKNMALRDSYLTPGGEAQWTLFDPMVAAYYARNYQKTGNIESAKKARQFIIRSLGSVMPHTKGDGKVVWRIPELFFLEKGKWVPSDHMGLLWAQANLLYGLRVYDEVFGEDLIK
jgi:phosphorylase kinase alpha/beta subunit